MIHLVNTTNVSCETVYNEINECFQQPIPQTLLYFSPAGHTLMICIWSILHIFKMGVYSILYSIVNVLNMTDLLFYANHGLWIGLLT